jgi:hypothetical protein
MDLRFSRDCGVPARLRMRPTGRMPLHVNDLVMLRIETGYDYVELAASRF